MISRYKGTAIIIIIIIIIILYFYIALHHIVNALSALQFYTGYTFDIYTHAFTHTYIHIHTGAMELTLISFLFLRGLIAASFTRSLLFQPLGGYQLVIGNLVL